MRVLVKGGRNPTSRSRILGDYLRGGATEEISGGRRRSGGLRSTPSTRSAAPSSIRVGAPLTITPRLSIRLHPCRSLRNSGGLRGRERRLDHRDDERPGALPRQPATTRRARSSTPKSAPKSLERPSRPTRVSARSAPRRSRSRGSAGTGPERRVRGGGRGCSRAPSDPRESEMRGQRPLRAPHPGFPTVDEGNPAHPYSPFFRNRPPRYRHRATAMRSLGVRRADGHEFASRSPPANTVQRTSRLFGEP